MKKTMMTLLVAGAALLGNGLASAGGRHSDYLDRKGDRIERRLDNKGDRIERRYDRAADRAVANGRPSLANRLDRRGTVSMQGWTVVVTASTTAWIALQESMGHADPERMLGR